MSENNNVKAAFHKDRTCLHPNSANFRLTGKQNSGTLLLIVLILITASSYCSAEQKKVLRSARELDYPPFSIVRPDGSADGFAVELLKAVVHAVSLDINMKVGPWHQIKKELEDGELDVLPLVSKSPERERFFDFSAPYLRMSSIALFVRKAERSIHDYTDLKHREVLVMRGDTAHEFAVRMAISNKLILTDNFEDAMKMLSKGDHDAVIVQQLVGLQIIKKLGITNLVNISRSQETTLKPVSREMTGFEQRFCFAVRKGQKELLGLLNEGLAITFANGTYDELYNKWFSPVLPQPPVPITLIVKYLSLILLPLLLVLALLGIWVLKREVASKTRFLTKEMVSRRYADEQYKSLFNKMMDGFALHRIVCNDYGTPVDYTFLAVNPAFEELTGLKSEHIIGRNVLEVLPGTEKTWIERYGKVALNGDNITFEEYSKEIGRYFAVTAYQPQYRQFACIFKDITDLKLSEDKESKLQQRLQQAQKIEAIGTLAGGIAHDFNNILAPILGHTEIMMEDIPEEDSNLQESLGEIYKAAVRARELVKQILTFSRQDSNDVKIIRVQPIIKEALKLIRSTIPTTIEIRRNISEECGAVYADPIQIHQIIMNLGTNAFHAMEERGGELSVTLREVELGEHDPIVGPDMEPGPYACIEISDTGSGIPVYLHSKIFDPFFTTKSNGKGTGLGLSVVHGIVKSMRGTINFYSEMEVGTRFNIYIPIVGNSDGEEVHGIESTLLKGRGRILLVDDEKSIVSMEKKMLEKLGYEVVSRVSSIEALEAFRTSPNRFDLIITDMAMPKISGDRLAEEIKKIRRDIPILLCTGFSNDMTADKAATLGIDRILMKPVIMKELANMVWELIGKKG